MNARIFKLIYGATPAQVVKSVYATGITESNELALTALIELMFEQEAKEKERVERRRRIANERSLAFKKELYTILEEHRGCPLKATEIQFSVNNFVSRYITNQKVARHLGDMLWKEEYPELSNFRYRGESYYIVGEIPAHMKDALVEEVEW